MADAGKRRYDFGGEIVPYKRPKNEIAIRKMHPQAMALSVSLFWIIVSAVFLPCCSTFGGGGKYQETNEPGILRPQLTHHITSGCTVELVISEECNGSICKVLESVRNALSNHMICQCNDCWLVSKPSPTKP